MLIGDEQRFRHVRVAAKYPIDGFGSTDARATEGSSLSALRLSRALLTRQALRGDGRQQRDESAAGGKQTDGSDGGITVVRAVESTAEAGCNCNERGAGEAGEKSGCK
jgi:hypothetical protein